MANKLHLLAVPLVLAALLFALSTAHATAHATATVPAAAPLAFEEEFEGEEEGELEEDECEAAEEEFEEGELEQADVEQLCAEEKKREKKEKGSGAGNNPSIAPEECVLRSAHAKANIAGAGKKLKLTIGYTTYEPIAAKLQIGHLATLHRHLGRSGVIRVVESLYSNNALKHLDVRIDIPSVKRAGCPSRRLVLFPR